MKKHLYIFSLLLMFSMTVHSKTWYLVRHAEKVDDGSKNPVLTSQGEQRAKNIAGLLATAHIDAIYATDYHRTQLTAKPLAELLGLPVTSYDPSALPAFAEQLKTVPGNALIVGHSNTTPMLAYLLSGQPMINLDDVDYDNVFQITNNSEQTEVTLLKSLPSQVAQPLTQFSPLHDRYFNGELTFNMLLNADVVGQSVHGFASQDGQYKLHEKTSIEAYNIHADISAVVNQVDLSPVSMNMQGTMGGPVDISMQWQGNSVKGHSEMAREGFKAQGRLAINTQLRPKTLERTSTIMLAHLLPVTEQQPLFLNWFNAYDADNRLINITYEGEESVTVPAGTFETVKIKYSGGAPSQYYWIDKNQAKVVKIQVIKSPWSYELVKAEIKS